MLSCYPIWHFTHNWLIKSIKSVLGRLSLRAVAGAQPSGSNGALTTVGYGLAGGRASSERCEPGGPRTDNRSQGRTDLTREFRPFSRQVMPTPYGKWPENALSACLSAFPYSDRLTPGNSGIWGPCANTEIRVPQACLAVKLRLSPGPAVPVKKSGGQADAAIGTRR